MANGVKSQELYGPLTTPKCEKLLSGNSSYTLFKVATDMWMGHLNKTTYLKLYPNSIIMRPKHSGKIQSTY